MSAGAEADQLVSVPQVGAAFIVFALKPIQINQQLFWSWFAGKWGNSHVSQSSFHHWSLRNRACLCLPDVACIFGNCSIAGEFSGASDIQDRLAGPSRRVGIEIAELLIRLKIRLEIRQMHVVVAVSQKRVAQWSKD